MKRIQKNQQKEASSISRRNFIKASSTAAGVFGSVMYSGISLAEQGQLRDALKEGKVANVWVNTHSANKWDDYYLKFVRLVENNQSAIDTSWIQPEKTYLLKLTIDNERDYPYSADAKLVYATLRYLTEMKSIPVGNIVITDQLMSLHQETFKARSEALRLSGLDVGIRRALPSKKARQLNSKKKLPIKWLQDINLVDEVIELSSLTDVNNQQRLDVINGVSSGDTPTAPSAKLFISSATKVGSGNSDLQVVSHQPGMLIGSNNRVSHELLSNAYLQFSIGEKPAVGYSDDRLVALKPGSESPVSSDNGFKTNKVLAQSDMGISPSIINAMKSDSHLAVLHWFSDHQDRPEGVNMRLREGYLSAINVDEMAFS